jgi:hypothetical protein
MFTKASAIRVELVLIDTVVSGMTIERACAKRKLQMRVSVCRLLFRAEDCFAILMAL